MCVYAININVIQENLFPGNGRWCSWDGGGDGAAHEVTEDDAERLWVDPHTIRYFYTDVSPVLTCM